MTSQGNTQCPKLQMRKLRSRLAQRPALEGKPTILIPHSITLRKPSVIPRVLARLQGTFTPAGLSSPATTQQYQLSTPSCPKPLWLAALQQEPE